MKNVKIYRGLLVGAVVLGVGLGVWLVLRVASVHPWDSDFEIVGRHGVEDFAEELVRYEGVFWEPRDTTILRRLIRKGNLVEDKTVLEIGTGTGLLAFCCLKAGARRVVATDINPMAVANARLNARRLGVRQQFEARLVPRQRPEAYSVIEPEEQFDYVISNPPWEDGRPRTIEEYARYDEGFQLLRSLLRDLRDHLKPGGRAYLVYGSTAAIRYARELAFRLHLRLRLLDDRDVNDLPETFLPGIILEVTPEPNAAPVPQLQ